MLPIGRYDLENGVPLPRFDNESADAELIVTRKGGFILCQHYLEEGELGDDEIIVSQIPLAEGVDNISDTFYIGNYVKTTELTAYDQMEAAANAFYKELTAELEKDMTPSSWTLPYATEAAAMGTRQISTCIERGASYLLELRDYKINTEVVLARETINGWEVIGTRSYDDQLGVKAFQQALGSTPSEWLENH